MVLKQQRGMPDTPETRKMVIDNIAIQLLVAQEAQRHVKAESAAGAEIRWVDQQLWMGKSQNSR